MGPYAAALSWPDLTTPPILGVLTLEIFISGILPVRSHTPLQKIVCTSFLHMARRLNANPVSPLPVQDPCSSDMLVHFEVYLLHALRIARATACF